ncbi:MAG: TIGR04282 family arsenosugar biosynthesis glycosyltransferase [Boseongicola sp.]
MVKEPHPGQVKTRLGREIGMISAAWWFRHQTMRLIRRLRDPRWQMILAVSPDYEGLNSRVWPVDLLRIPQGTGDLGARMARALRATFGPTVLIGADIPGVKRRHIADAFRALGSSPSAVGPATDGGYWCVALRHPVCAPLHMFNGVRWSTKFALEDTLPTLPQPVARLAKLADVDAASDLAQ